MFARLSVISIKMSHWIKKWLPPFANPNVKRPHIKILDTQTLKADCYWMDPPRSKVQGSLDYKLFILSGYEITVMITTSYLIVAFSTSSRVFYSSECLHKKSAIVLFKMLSWNLNMEYLTETRVLYEIKVLNVPFLRT